MASYRTSVRHQSHEYHMLYLFKDNSVLRNAGLIE